VKNQYILEENITDLMIGEEKPKRKKGLDFLGGLELKEKGRSQVGNLNLKKKEQVQGKEEREEMGET